MVYDQIQIVSASGFTSSKSPYYHAISRITVSEALEVTVLVSFTAVCAAIDYTVYLCSTQRRNKNV